MWEYLTNRQLNSFLPCITITDVVGGYELPAAEYTAPPVRRALKAAALASALVNDLYSSGDGFDLPSVIAAEERCGPAEAVQRSIEIHDELVPDFEAEAAVLTLTGSPQLKRYLSGVWGWLGGNREWHAGTTRYRSAKE